MGPDSTDMVNWLLHRAREPVPPVPEPVPGDDEELVAWEADGHSSQISTDLTDAGLQIALAEAIQDDVIHEVWHVWPECPGHPHPLVPLVVNEDAAWICPQDGRVMAAIGELGAS